ncbi:MAG: type II toxin-antitoxin system Phd/YefM family antitoxin [Nitrospirae bacterium]|nr:type II toxin-antitoxin system Phd/YefM family antitoxin [Nitrospirota bacterium]
MRAVGIKILKNRLSEYVRIASNGETVLVTDRDKVVAELTPPQPGRAPGPSDALFADLIRKGLVTPARRPGRPLPPRNPVMKFEDLMKDLAKSRADR